MSVLASALSLARALRPEPAPKAAGVRYGPVTPDDKPLIQAAMGRLSPETSRQRFFSVRRSLSEPELKRLTELDGWNRYAIGASVRHPDGSVEGVGIARFARLAGDNKDAELGMLVVDGWQGMGIGKRLLALIREAAVARRIERLSGLVLKDNKAMLALLKRHAPGTHVIDAGDCYRVEIPLERRLRVV
jgi:GNAT superfamily N-acetyltransferase